MPTHADTSPTSDDAPPGPGIPHDGNARHGIPHDGNARHGTPKEWTPSDGGALYGLDQWGGGYFDVSEDGTVVARPRGIGAESPGIDLLEVVRGLEARDIITPVVLRFDDILAHRMRHLRDAFDAART